MKYFYEGRCEIPDFAALAVLESQNCPNSIVIKDYEYYEYKEYKEQICTSRYRIIRILDAVSEDFKKEYLEAKEKPVFSNFRHRPMLVFGKYKNGMIQIEGHEEMREYFDPFNHSRFIIYYQNLEFMPLVGHLSAVYLLHSIGTPYYNINNLDSIDIMSYNEYLKPFFRQLVEYAGKDFGKLLLRLIHNREPIKATKIKNGFAALGVIKNVRSVGDAKQAELYELSLGIETVFKNNAKIDSNIAIFIDKDHLPLGWSCQPLEHFLMRKPFYFFGDLKNGSLLIDSLTSTRDVFVFGDTIYDISMGLPFRELLAYFLPSNMSFEEFEFGKKWENLFKHSSSSAAIVSKPECLKKDIMQVGIKWIDFFADSARSKRIYNNQYNRDIESLFDDYSVLDEFRCREPAPDDFIYIDNLKPFPKKEEACVVCHQPLNLKGKGIWGK
jgi:hypothetical protein